MKSDTDSLGAGLGVEPANSRPLMRIVFFSTALAFGAAAASAQALQFGAGGFGFKFSIGTLVAFLLGAGSAFLFWHLAGGGRSGVWKSSLLMIAVGLGLFLYPLRFVQTRLLPEVAIGLTTAVFALSVLGFLVWQVKRALDADEKENQ